MPLQSDLYKYHSDNFRSVGCAFESVTGAARDAIRARDTPGVRALTFSAALLLGAKIECRLKKLLFEPASFTDAERSLVTSPRNQIQRWSIAIDVGFRRRYNVWRLDEASVGADTAARHRFLHDTLATSLRPIVEVRNRLAHGQWEHALNSNETDLSPDLHTQLMAESVETLSIKDRVSFHYSRIIEDLIISAAAFERDYTASVDKLRQVLTSLECADFEQYEDAILRRSTEGRARRLAVEAGQRS